MKKEITMFMMPTCPHCRNALSMMEELCRENPEYKEVPVKMVDELSEPEYASRFDYHYVPTYYVDGVKLHEGIPTKEAVEQVYREACADDQ